MEKEKKNILEVPLEERSNKKESEMEKKEEGKKKVVLDYLKEYHKKYKVEDLKKKIIEAGYPAEYVEEALITLSLKKPAEKKPEEELKKKAEEIGVAKKEYLREKVIIIILIILILLVLLILIIFAFYIYFEKIEKYLGLGANIEEAKISKDGKIAYIKLAGGINYGNITKIKFVFADKEGNENYYETSEGASEISVPFKRSFLQWLFRKPVYEGKYDYEINANEINLENFENIEEVSVSFEYKSETRDINETGIITSTNITRIPTCSDKIKNGNETGIDCGGSCKACVYGGGSRGDGTTPPPCIPKTCLELGYNCEAFNNGCGSIINCGSCEEEYSCNEGKCVAKFPQDYVAYWKFDTSAGGITPDETGINNGTLFDNAQIINDTEKGNVLNLDGNNDYVDVGNSSTLDSPTMTIIAWIKPTDITSVYILSKPYTSNANPYYQYNIYLTSLSKLEVDISADGTWYWNITNTSIKANRWQQVALVYNGTDILPYINSVQSGRTNVTGAIDSYARNLTIGTNEYSGVMFNGSIDDVMIYNRALNETEIQQIYNAQKPVSLFPQDYVSYWKFDASAAGITPDEAGINNGILFDNAQIINDAEKGNVLSLDGDGDYVSCGNDSSLDFSSDFAIVFWFKHHGRQAAYDIIFQKGTSWDLSKMDLELENIGPEFLSFTYAGRNNVYNLPQPTPNEWHNVALVVYDNTRIEGYIDGSLNQSFDISGVPSQINNNINFYIGGLSLGNYFNGSIDDVMIFNRALNETEIQQIYCAQGGNASFCPSIGGGAGTLSPFAKIWEKIIEFFKKIFS